MVCIVFLFNSCPCPREFLLFLREQQGLEKPPLGPKLEPFVPPLVSSFCSSVFSEVPQADTDMVLNPAKGARSQHQSKAVKAHYYYYYYVFFSLLSATKQLVWMALSGRAIECLSLGCSGLQRPCVVARSIAGCALIYSALRRPEKKIATQDHPTSPGSTATSTGCASVLLGF